MFGVLEPSELRRFPKSVFYAETNFAGGEATESSNWLSALVHRSLEKFQHASTMICWYAQLICTFKAVYHFICNVRISAQFCGVSLRWKSVLSLKAKETWSILLGLGTWTKWSGSLVLTTPWRFATAPLLQSSSLCFGRVCFVVQTYSSAFWGLQFWQGIWPSKVRQLKTFRQWI